jgi:hypothetical protein
MLSPLSWSLGATAVFMAIGWAIFRNAKVVGVVASAWLLLFFSYGRVASGLAGASIGRTRYLLPAWALLGLAALVTAYVFRSRLAGVTKALNLVVAVLVAMNLVPIALYRPPANSPASLTGPLGKVLSAAKSAKLGLPDIYYIVPEDYGDERTLREIAGVDTRPFLRYLEKQGFYVARDSMANYQNTPMAMAAALNLQYLPTLLGDDAKSYAAAARMLRGFAVSKFLQGLGYRYVHIGHWWTPTRTDSSADIDVKPGSLSEFSSILYDTTILPTLSRKLNVEQAILDPRRGRYELTLQELKDIVQTTKLRGPKFVFAHLGIPHLPALFDRNGRFVTADESITKRSPKYFADQVSYTTKRLQSLVGQILQGTHRKAIIILQTDEGPDLLLQRTAIREGRFQSRRFRPALLAKYRILNAFFLPGIPYDRLYPSITLVNTFRLVFDLYFKTGLGLLPDQTWALRRDPKEFVNITRLLHGG